MRIAYRVLHILGATEVPLNQADPQTEEEFQSFQYTSSNPITWGDYQAKYNEVMQTFALKQLRAERNRRIASTDWIMTVDNAETLANKSDWIVYRQLLRDLPENPPVFVWNDTELDFSRMNMPVEPPVIRIGNTPAPASEPTPETPPEV
jgi:hypothetical protein